jgi:hypothetical protein
METRLGGKRVKRDLQAEMDVEYENDEDELCNEESMY